MNDDAVMTVLMVGAVVFIVMLGIGFDSQRNRLTKYDDTISEYMMCIEYNPDCECSDIILSEYGEEVE